MSSPNARQEEELFIQPDGVRPLHPPGAAVPY